MQWDAGNIYLLYARSSRKTQTTQQITAPWIWGTRQLDGEGLVFGIQGIPSKNYESLRANLPTNCA
jgi:hypothetical protein